MRRFVLLVVGGPALVGLAGVLTVLAIRADLPDPVATHWDNAGPDGFTSRTWAFLPALIGPLVGIGIGGATGWYGRREAAARRLGAGLATGTAAFVAAVAVGSLWVQRGLASAADAPGIGGVLAAALPLGLLLGVAVALLVPGDVPVPATRPVPGPRLDLAPGERAAWSAWTAVPAAVLAVPVVALLPLLVLAALGVAPVFLALTVLLVVAVFALTMAARVWVDQRGLTVRSPFGWPSVVVPLAEVAGVAVVEVDPLRDFGGWGYRIGRRGRAGVVFRHGEALEVTRADGRRFAVTVPGAAEAAVLLTTLTDRVPHTG